MEFGEKLFKLRKENGMSQESLAERLNTSRQAISKWENGQGCPETEKLLLISNIFNVSLDYLLKDGTEHVLETERGYYVSKETIEGFLIYESKTSKLVGIGIGLLILSAIPYFMLEQTIAVIIIAVIVMMAVGVLLSASFIENNYKVLKQESLIFDEKVLKDLKMKYSQLRMKYMIFSIVSALSIVAGGTLLILFEKQLYIPQNFDLAYSISSFFIAIGFSILIHMSTMMESYDLLIKNEEYYNKLSSKLLRRWREKISKL